MVLLARLKRLALESRSVSSEVWWKVFWSSWKENSFCENFNAAGTLHQKVQLTVQYIIVECFPVDVGWSSALSGERLQGGRPHVQHGGDVQQGPAERMERATAEHPPPGQLALQRRHSPHHTLAGRHQWKVTTLLLVNGRGELGEGYKGDTTPPPTPVVWSNNLKYKALQSLIWKSIRVIIDYSRTSLIQIS